MMYWPTWVHVTARIPPRNEHTSMPPRATKMPSSNEMPVRRVVMMPTP
ncbi:Uncharacterised protein [Bordetella pertussis]|nr:Uncharacterised protein [Bordetella pertussis]CPN34075.1 Uncharacterised protein [Bordetella pertussis]